MSEVPPPPPPPAYPPPPGFPGAAGPTPGKGKAITSMILGIVSVVLCLYWFIAIPAGIAAIILGVLARREGAARGMALAGLITGIIGAAFGLLMVVLGLAGLGIEGYCEENPDNAICETQ